jgi:pimeloyl-ACP methyl ester carboxylesterase
MPQHVVPGTGRWPHVDAPGEVAETLLEWWAVEGIERKGGDE